MTEEIKKEEGKSVEVKKDIKEAMTSKPRQIVIETDGNSVNLVKAEVSGSLELVAVLQTLINFINKK
jgi:hypothetical protein